MHVEGRKVLVIVESDCDVVDAAWVRLLVMNAMLIGKKLVRGQSKCHLGCSCCGHVMCKTYGCHGGAGGEWWICGCSRVFLGCK